MQVDPTPGPERSEGPDALKGFGVQGSGFRVQEVEKARRSGLRCAQERAWAGCSADSLVIRAFVIHSSFWFGHSSFAAEPPSPALPPGYRGEGEEASRRGWVIGAGGLARIAAAFVLVMTVTGCGAHPSRVTRLPTPVQSPPATQAVASLEVPS